MSSAAKKKTGAKDRSGTEGTAAVASVQSAFTSAARATMWHLDASSATSNHHHSSINNRDVAASAVPHTLADSPSVYTAAVNAVCGRPFGAVQMEDPWAQAEAQPCVQDVEKLLPLSPAWAAEREAYTRLFTTTASPDLAPTTTAASPDNAGSAEEDEKLPSAGDRLYEEWLAHVAARRSTPLLYPHHTLHFDAASMLATTAAAAPTPSSPAPSTCTQVAIVLHRLLTAYLERCCAQPAADNQNAATHPLHHHTVPSRVFASVLYTSVYNNNFSGPAAEQPDVAFFTAAATKAEATKPSTPALPRRYDALSVVSCLGVDHLCVCVGQRYYKLRVLDARRGRLRTVEAIAAGLESICRHCADAHRADPLVGVSPAVRHDHAAMTSMFAALSRLDDGDAFEVRRRLCDASPVNAYTLDTLQAGLCTLVLRDAALTDEGGVQEGMASAEWRHSVCSLEVSLRQPSQWLLRLQAAVVPATAGVEWITRATRLSWATAATTESPTRSRASATTSTAMDAEKVGTADASAAPPHTALSTPLDDEGRAEYLELWLPEKHRIPLRPYPQPRWDPNTTGTAVESFTAAAARVESTGCTLDRFLMRVLEASVQLKLGNKFSSLSSSPPSTATGAAAKEMCEGETWPRVVLAVHPLRGGAPSLVALDSPAIQHYYEVLAARPLLFAKESRRRIEAAALAEVRALINIAWHATSTVRTHPPHAARTAIASVPSMTWWDALEKTPADVCVTFAVLPRATPAASAAAVRRVTSSLGLSSELLVNCTAQQTAAEAHVRAGAARVVDAIVQASAPSTVEVCRAFCHALAACKQD